MALGGTGDVGISCFGAAQWDEDRMQLIFINALLPPVPPNVPVVIQVDLQANLVIPKVMRPLSESWSSPR